MSFQPSDPTSGFTSPSGWEPHDDATAIGDILRGATAPSSPSSPPEEDLPPVTHYAAPTAVGLGDGSSPADAFTIADFVALPPSPGDHLQVKSETITSPLDYSGPSSRILPASGVNGTEEDRIVISCEVDGGVLIDGGGNDVAVLSQNDWWILQGFNAHNGDIGVVAIYSDCVGSIARKIVAWDVSPSKNSVVFPCSNYFGTNLVPYTDRIKRGNLFEDCAGFGTGRSIFSSSQYDYRTTHRRCWGQMEYWSAGDGSQTRGIQIGYQSHESLAENIIFTMDMQTPEPPDPDDWRALLKFGRVDKPTGVDVNSRSRFLASIVYSLSEQNAQHLKYLFQGFQSVGGNEARDLVLYTENLLKGSLASLKTQTGDPSEYTDITEIDTAGNPGYADNGWVVTNREQHTSVAAAPSPFQTTAGAGARVYYRTVDGVLTTDPLWPWPMDERIRQALLQSGRDPDTMFRGAGHSVTDLMGSIFGTIPGI